MLGLVGAVMRGWHQALKAGAAYKRKVPWAGNLEPVVPRTRLRVVAGLPLFHVSPPTRKIEAESLHAEWMRGIAFVHKPILRRIANHGKVAADVNLCSSREIEFIVDLGVRLFVTNEASVFWF